MTVYAPSWAAHAQALDGTNDSQLAAGVHLRILPSLEMGLPFSPLYVYRVPLGPSAKDAKPRTDIVWLDENDQVLKPPFSISTGHQVRGILPQPGRCFWIEVGIKPGSPFGGPIARGPVVSGPVAPATVPAAAPIKPPAAAAVMPPAAAAVMPPATAAAMAPATAALTSTLGARPLGPALPLPIFRPPPVAMVPIRVEAMVTTPRGPAVAASMSNAPYQLSAQGIEYVVVSGNGVITGVQWLDRIDLPEQPWRVWSLPLAHSAARYPYPRPTGETDAMERLDRGAPRRQALYQDQSINLTRDTAVPATAADERTRTNFVRAIVADELATILTDVSASPWDLKKNVVIPNSTGGGAPTRMQIPLLGHVIQAALDPGVARWMGLADVDESPPHGERGDVVAYVIRGVWAIDPKQLGRRFTLFDPEAALSVNTNAAAVGVADFRSYALKLPTNLPPNLVDIMCVACVNLGNPPDQPHPPSLQWTNDGAWLPVTPPAAERLVGITAHGLSMAGMVAFARKEATGVTSLQPRVVLPDGSKVTMPLMAGASGDAAPGDGYFEDRHAPGEKLGYRMAQSDWFGRWSLWSELAVAAKQRTAPPVPTVEVSYVPPTVTTPLPTGNLTGRLMVRVALPTADTLPPGGRLLSRLELHVDGVDVTFSVTRTIPLPATEAAAWSNAPPPPDDPNAPPIIVLKTDARDSARIEGMNPAHPPAAPVPDSLVVELDGPPLAVAQLASVTVSAKWIDDGAVSSSPSTPVRRQLVDPRPPAWPQPALPSDLRYSARPDVTGRARVELHWPQGDSASFRVFYADENQLLAGLKAKQATTEYNELSAAATLPAPRRAALFLTHASLYDWSMFENLTKSPLLPPTSGDVSFEHSLSGSLKALSFYRILAVSAGNVPCDFPSAPLLPVAVPNDGPPGRPLLSLKAYTNPRPFAVDVSVHVPLGGPVPVRLRVRRSSLALSDAHKMMPLVEVDLPTAPTTSPTAPLTSVDLGQKMASFILHDADGLLPWRTYYYAVEVRAGAISGGAASAPGGDWSPPSVVAAVAVIPAAPEAVATFSAVRDATGVMLTWTHTHAAELTATPMGEHRFQLWRGVAGGRAALVPVPLQVPPSGGAPFSFQFHDDNAPADVIYRIAVMDPIGRTSPLSSPVRL
jgi:hypothetical protein